MNSKKFLVLNISFYLLLIYQFIILIVGNAQYHSFSIAPEGLCLIPLVLIYMHLFMIYAKGVCVAWNEFGIRLIFGKQYTYDAENMYYRKKRTMFIALVVAGSLAVLSTIANMVVSKLVPLQSIFGFFSISALLVMALCFAFGLIAVIWQIKKQWTNEMKSFILFKSVLLQNFLVALALVNMLYSA
jgi:hypothetical protein